MVPWFLAATLLWVLPALLIVGFDIDGVCRPGGHCLGRVLPRLAEGMVYVPVAYLLAAAAAAATDRTHLPDRYPWLFAPSRPVLVAVAGLATVTVALLVAAIARSLFTTALALLTFTLAVPLFDGVVVLDAIDREPFTLAVAVVGGSGLIAAQVLWWYGLAHGLVRLWAWGRDRLD